MILAGIHSLRPCSRPEKKSGYRQNAPDADFETSRQKCLIPARGGILFNSHERSDLHLRKRMMSTASNQCHPISLCMIVKNEEAVLGRCLASVKGVADEIIVVDTGSTDRTVEIAEKAGARVIADPWQNDFSRARNVSIANATGDWVLWLDADDVIPEPSVLPLQRIRREKPDRVLSFIIKNERPGGTGSSFVQARMFPRRNDVYFERRIHEQVTLSALRAGLVIEQRPIVIEHHGYADPVALKRKAQRNIAMLLEEYRAGQPDPVMAVEIADAYAICGDVDNAKRWYRAVLSTGNVETIMPSIASQAYLGIGNCCNEQGKYDQAAISLRTALALAPGRPDVLYSIAVALELGGKPGEAVDSLMRILDIKEQPLDVSIDFREARLKAFLRLERLLRTRGCNDQAVALAQRALTELSHRPEIHAMAGRSFLCAGRLMEALHAFEKSLTITGPANIDAQIGLCRVYMLAGRRETAEQVMAAARPLFQSTPRYWAFCRTFLNGKADQPMPAEISAEAIAKEEDYLRMIFSVPA